MGNGWRHLSEDGVQFKHIISNPMVNGIFYFLEVMRCTKRCTGCIDR